MSLKKASICMILVITVLLCGCSQAKPYYDDIEVGMSYEEVVEIIGREPDSIKEYTVDSARYLWSFNDKKESLIIEFQANGNNDQKLFVKSVSIAKYDGGLKL